MYFVWFYVELIIFGVSILNLYHGEKLGFIYSLNKYVWGHMKNNDFAQD